MRLEPQARQVTLAPDTQQDDYPAVLVLSRLDRATGTVRCFRDNVTLNSQKEVDARAALYAKMEHLGGLPYDLQVVAITDADACVEATRQVLEGHRCEA